MERYHGFIHQPIEPDSTAHWQRFLASMKRVPQQDDPRIQNAIQNAEAELTVRQLAGHPDQPLDLKERMKYWAMQYPSGPHELSPIPEWLRALISLRDPKIYPQGNPVVRQHVMRAEQQMEKLRAHLRHPARIQEHRHVAAD